MPALPHNFPSAASDTPSRQKHTHGPVSFSSSLLGNIASTGVNAWQRFITETERSFVPLDSVMPELRWLSDVQTLTYLQATISTHLHPIKVPFPLDALLIDQPFKDLHMNPTPERRSSRSGIRTGTT